MKALRGLYPVVDVDVLSARGADPVRFAEAVLSSEPPILQLRAKHADDQQILGLAKKLLPLSNARGTRFVLNDRPDLADASGASWVHVGQSDMAASQLHVSYPTLSYGTSTHTDEQLRTALVAKPAYVAYGPVFSTTSKENPDAVVGIAGLRAAHRHTRASGVPLVAIGGITEARLADVAKSAELIAIISALVPAAGACDDAFYAAVATKALRFHQSILSVHAALETRS